jgi:curli biogenesis system outer membrane secretion channel CsgG
MKRCILFFILAVFVLTIGNSYAEEKPRIGVLRFTNNVAGLYWWHSSVADDLADLLTSELVTTRAFQILERKEINAVFSEQDLSASGRVSQETMVQMKKLKGAKYLIAGTVSAFEESGSTGGGIRFKGLSLGAKKSEVYIAVDVKIVDTETGEVVDARTIEGRAKATKIGADLDLRNFSVGGEKAKNTPIGKAIRACILYISEYLSCSLVEGLDAPCMDEWNQADTKRKNKTKKSIVLD